jgi:hypothetical protein
VPSESTVALGHFLDFFLLLQSVGRLNVALLAGDDLVSKGLGDGLVGLDGALAATLGDQVDGLIDPAQGGHVHGLLADHTAGTDTGGVLTGTHGQHGVDEHFEGALSGQEVDDLEGVPHDADGLDLLAGVPAGELHGADESFDDGAEGLAELFALVPASSVGHEHLSLGALDCDVVNEAWVLDLARANLTVISS